MDEFIRRFDAVKDDDLMLCMSHGVAYQADFKKGAVPYDEAYFNKCLSYEDQEIARAINRGRVDLVNKYVGQQEPVLDIGVGSGEFIKNRPRTYGYDVNPKAKEWLTKKGYWRSSFNEFRAFTFWDVIEHLGVPAGYFRHVPAGGAVFTSIPIFEDLTKVRESRHYRPGEHLYYWTADGFIRWMGYHGFRLLEQQDYETKAGRDSILSFAFCKDEPGYHYHVAQYMSMHETRHYGGSASMYLDLIAPLISKLKVGSILDYGCGRSDLVAYFWAEGKRRLERFDPAISEYKVLPKGPFDLVFCCDVMEHIPMPEVPRVFGEIQSRGKNVIFVISTKPARAHLPDGRNAHVTLLTKSEWTRWIAATFGTAIEVPTPWPHALMLKTF